MMRSVFVLLLLAAAGCAYRSIPAEPEAVPRREPALSPAPADPAAPGPQAARRAAAFLPPAAVAGATAPAAGAAITVDDLIRRDRVTQAVISPGGDRVAYVLLTPDFETNKYQSAIWIVGTAGEEAVRLSHHEGASSPAWSPDGTQLAFVSKRSGRNQIWVASPGGEPRQVTRLGTGATRPIWSPDGRTIAFFARKSPGDDEGAGVEPAPGAPTGAAAAGAADVRVVTALEDREAFDHIWTLSFGGTEPRRVTTEPFYYEDPAWSPDGTMLAFACNEKGTRAVDEDSCVAVMPATGGPIRRLTPGGVYAGAPSWSHDGRRIAYFRDRHVEYGAYLNMKDLYVHDLEANQSYCLTFMSEAAIGGFDSIPRHPAAWSADDAWLYVLGAEGPYQNIYRVSALGSRLEKVSAVSGEIYGPTFSRDGEQAAFLMGSFVQVPEVYASETRRFEPRRLTGVMEPLKRLAFREPETLRFASRDGLAIEGFLFYPDGYEAGRRVPLVVDIHGGPASSWGARIPLFTPWRVYNHLGMAVLLVNPRGSTGYGAAFRRGNYRGFGLDDLNDILAGVDHVIDMGVADPDRLGVAGYSYGGFLTNRIITSTNRFKAAVSIAGAANYISAYCQANPVLPRVFYGGAPWEEPAELYFRHSPVVRAGGVTTPVLLIHGEDDQAVHSSQSIEFFRALIEAGVETELVIYPREGHNIAEPSHWRDYMQRSVDWFAKRLLN